MGEGVRAPPCRDGVDSLSALGITRSCEGLGVKKGDCPLEAVVEDDFGLGNGGDGELPELESGGLSPTLRLFLVSGPEF